MILFALNLKYLSGTAYRAIRQSGMINHPSEHTHYPITATGQHHILVYIEFIEQFQSLYLRKKCLVDSTIVPSPSMK